MRSFDFHTHHHTGGALLAAALLTALASAANAADVRLYGRVSLSMHYAKSEADTNGKLTMMNEGSRWGLDIREDISPDLSAKAYLESGINADTGELSNSGSGGLTSSMLFDRHSVLALSSKTYGEFAFGRMGSVRSAVMPYSLALLQLDPVNGAYYDIGSIGVMFGADPRAHNTATWVSPRWGGFKVGASYSFSTNEEEGPNASNNNRLAAIAGNYENGRLGVYFGATHNMQGKADASSPLLDKAKRYERKDGQTYTLGMTWKPDDTLKLYAAMQYQTDARAVAGWKMDAPGTLSASGERLSEADRKNGIDGFNFMLGANYWITPKLRATGIYHHFTGEHELADGKTEDGSRHLATAVLDYRLSKTVLLYSTLTYSKGKDAMDDDVNINKTVGRVGMMKFF